MPNPFEKYLTEEDRHHIVVVNHLKNNYPKVIAFHVPNEGKKTAFERYKFSLFGNKKGICDFVILSPQKGYHGLLIELKAPERKKIISDKKGKGRVVKIKSGKPTDEQIDICFSLNMVGYKCHICYGSSEAIKIIDEYFK